MKFLLTISLFIVVSLHAKADTFWIETKSNGAIGQTQLIKVLFGSTISNNLQKVTGKFKKVKDFTCWIVAPSGKKYLLKMEPADTAYQSEFTPQENGIYTVLLENKLQEVEDWRNTKSKIGIAKQDYYACTNFIVGDIGIGSKDVKTLTKVSIINKNIGDVDHRKLNLQVLSEGKPIVGVAVFVRNPSKNEQKCITDQNGEINFIAPEPGKYVALVTLRSEKPGTFKGVHYDVFREKASYVAIVQ